MSKNTATEEVLGTLHAKVAGVMLGILSTTEKAIEAYEEASETADAETLAAMIKPELAPSMLSAMTKFLSDNKITCNPAESESLSDLDKRLREKRKRKSVGNVVPMIPEDD